MIRNYKNPILTRNDIPNISPQLIDVSSVFNPGAVKVGSQYLLMLRVQNRGRQTFFVMARSENGIDFTVDNKLVEFKNTAKIKDSYYHFYDPRITKFEEIYYIIFAIDFEGSTKLGLARTKEFEEFEFVDVVSDIDTRNGVLFPEMVNGYYLRYERPNNKKIENGPLTGNTIYLSRSKNLIKWDAVAPVATGNFHYWDELIGSGPPPVKTRSGWLHIYHGIATHYTPIYQAGVMITELDQPEKVISRGTQNILEPRKNYELIGQVPNVVFPSGIIVEEIDDEGFAENESEVKIYYGAADTSVGLATTTIDKLIKKCYE